MLSPRSPSSHEDSPPPHQKTINISISKNGRAVVQTVSSPSTNSTIFKQVPDGINVEYDNIDSQEDVENNEDEEIDEQEQNQKVALHHDAIFALRKVINRAASRASSPPVISHTQSPLQLQSQQSLAAPAKLHHRRVSSPTREVRAVSDMKENTPPSSMSKKRSLDVASSPGRLATPDPKRSTTGPRTPIQYNSSTAGVVTTPISRTSQTRKSSRHSSLNYPHSVGSSARIGTDALSPMALPPQQHTHNISYENIQYQHELYLRQQQQQQQFFQNHFMAPQFVTATHSHAQAPYDTQHQQHGQPNQPQNHQQPVIVTPYTAYSVSAPHPQLIMNDQMYYSPTTGTFPQASPSPIYPMDPSQQHQHTQQQQQFMYQFDQPQYQYPVYSKEQQQYIPQYPSSTSSQQH